MTSTELISRRCKITPLEAERIVQLVCGDDLPEIKTLDAYDFERDIFTSGDEHLDRALGGGVRTGMIWEVVGERSVSTFHIHLGSDVLQRCWEDAASPTFVSYRPTASGIWRPFRIDLLLDDVLQAAYCASTRNSQWAPQPSPFVVRARRHSYHAFPKHPIPHRSSRQDSPSFYRPALQH